MASALAVQNIQKPRLLIVEDEPFILLTLEDMLSDLGCTVAGSVTRVSEALDFIERESIDGALLDVNLGHQKIDPVADRLAALGQPFIFTTGYGPSGVPPTHNQRPVLQKPFRMDDLAKILRAEFKLDLITLDS
ncbi:response regulator [Beijerinckia indica]|uniref:Response regulator receiver protein n=1 Tax=Beijerinckia indica subsp. indica (strain ATCC 9039 / DSM 1715 / NCIMB 8712) TaxID=395963 RepID=B2IDY8_BEII9|nr:response regulator [Beijerinckia indica]ACB96920.1 response regulator receiver protein [Beijerinckia indica subsp. indica ATCC 9039]